MLHVSIASARLKFGISGMTRKSRTYVSTARSQPFPIVPARMRAPQTSSSFPRAFCFRNTAAISGTAASET